MPRYYFHFSDGARQFSDDTGTELAGLSAARAHATQQVRDLKAAMCDQVIQDLSAWSMSVADARGRIVFVLGFDLKPLTPAAPARSSPGTSPAPPPAPTPAPAHADAVTSPAGRARAARKD